MKYLISKGRLIELTVSMISNEIVEYSIHEESGQYQLRDNEDKCLINYQSKSKELYYDHSLFVYIRNFIPLGYDTTSFKEGVKEYFNYQFPDLVVRSVHGAHIA